MMWRRRGQNYCIFQSNNKLIVTKSWSATAGGQGHGTLLFHHHHHQQQQQQCYIKTQRGVINSIAGSGKKVKVADTSSRVDTTLSFLRCRKTAQWTVDEKTDFLQINCPRTDPVDTPNDFCTKKSFQDYIRGWFWVYSWWGNLFFSHWAAKKRWEKLQTLHHSKFLV